MVLADSRYKLIPPPTTCNNYRIDKRYKIGRIFTLKKSENETPGIGLPPQRKRARDRTTLTNLPLLVTSLKPKPHRHVGTDGKSDFFFFVSVKNKLKSYSKKGEINSPATITLSVLCYIKTICRAPDLLFSRGALWPLTENFRGATRNVRGKHHKSTCQPNIHISTIFHCITHKYIYNSCSYYNVPF